MNILVLLKISFFLSLFASFLYFFGLPSWRKYLAREVFISRQKISIHEIPPPAITFCAEKQGEAWRSDNSSSEIIPGHEIGVEMDIIAKHSILNQCKDSHTVEEVYNCVDAKTFNLTEIIAEAFVASSATSRSNSSDIARPEFWIPEISLTSMGKCHTLNNSVSLKDAKWNFHFDPLTNLNTIFIHDPHYFLITGNPATIPMITLDMSPSQGLVFMYIEVVQHVNMDRQKQPCEASKDYSFTACLRNSVAAKASCRYEL